MRRIIKRAVVLLILIGLSVSYIQLTAMEQWSKFLHFRIRISQRLQIRGDGGIGSNGGKTTPGVNLLYFDYNEEESANNMLDIYTGNSPDEYLVESEPDIEKIAWEQKTKVLAEEQKSDQHNFSETNRTKQNPYRLVKLKRFIAGETDFSSKPLMVLFSSWVKSADKAPVHDTLKRLWSAWPSIKPVVLTNDIIVRRECTRSGWGILNVTDSDPRCHGPPVLTSMFLEVLKQHDAYFYGYSNADIVYGEGLEKTLKYLHYHFSPWKTKPVLIVGRRHNVDFIKYRNATLKTPNDVEKLTEHGKLVIRSTDYFFTNRHFPWGQAPKVTIGRPFVVRAIIGWALQRGFFVIDATKTIESVHLTTKDGVFASWHKKGKLCNERVLAALRWRIPTSYGHCECAKLETFYIDKNNRTIRLRHRPQSKKLCGR